MPKDFIVYEIQSDYFTASFTMHDGEILAAAPIIYYIYSWPLAKIKAYCNKKGWTLTELHK